MLVVSRKVGERIWIGDEISVTVVKVEGGRVRLGIEAAPNLVVVRDELKNRTAPAASASPTRSAASEPRSESAR